MPTANGTYAVVIDNGNCSDTSECSVVDNIGLEDIQSLAIKMYPNPSTGIIHFESLNDIEKVQVYDLQGKLITEQSLANNTINLRPIASGVYMIHCHLGEKGIWKELILIQ